MKILTTSILLVLLSFSVALADWQETFKTDYESIGIDQAVINAMKEGSSPEQILQAGLELEGLNPQNLLKALYCAGANGNDIKEAAMAADISELLISIAYEKSIVECYDQLADTQAYTPIGKFSGLPDTNHRTPRSPTGF